MDFNDYLKNNSQQPNDNSQGLFGLVSSLANKFDGKSQKELIDAIYSEARKGKQNGTLTNKDIDNFVSVISPVLDAKKRKYLIKIAEELKRI